MQNNREELQNAAFETVKEDRRAVLEWGTGIGKSRVAIRLLDWAENWCEEKRFLLVVAQTSNKENWRREFTEAVGEDRADELFPKITVECYESLHHYKDTHWDVIVFDEAHHLRSELRQEILSSLSADRVLCLTATFDDRGDAQTLKDTLENTFGEFVYLDYSLQQAIDDEILPPPRIIVDMLTMPEHLKKDYREIDAAVKKARNEYKNARKKYGFAPDDKTQNEETGKIYRRMMISGARRKKFLADIKTGRAADYIHRYRETNRRFVCYCNDIEQMTLLGGSNYICSEKTQRENQEIINFFNTGRMNEIFAVGMIQEAENLNGIEAGIIIQPEGKDRRFIQKLGRVMRSSDPEIRLLTVLDTKDDENTERVLEHIDPKYIEGWECVEARRQRRQKEFEEYKKKFYQAARQQQDNQPGRPPERKKDGMAEIRSLISSIPQPAAAERKETPQQRGKFIAWHNGRAFTAVSENGTRVTVRSISGRLENIFIKKDLKDVPYLGMVMTTRDGSKRVLLKTPVYQGLTLLRQLCSGNRENLADLTVTAGEGGATTITSGGTRLAPRAVKPAGGKGRRQLTEDLLASVRKTLGK